MIKESLKKPEWVSKLSLEDFYKLYNMFEKDDEIVLKELKITISGEWVTLKATIEFYVEEDKAYDTAINSYDINDFCAEASGSRIDYNIEYRKYMFEKFGNEYAIDYLLRKEWKND